MPKASARVADGEVGPPGRAADVVDDLLAEIDRIADRLLAAPVGERDRALAVADGDDPGIVDRLERAVSSPSAPFAARPSTPAQGRKRGSGASPAWLSSRVPGR